MNKVYFLIYFSLISHLVSISQEYQLPIYDKQITNSDRSELKEKVEKSDIIFISNVNSPEIYVYLPSEKLATGQAVIICPGGGYFGLAFDLEGTDVAKYLNSIGISAIVLKYRVCPATLTNYEPYIMPLQDAQRAMRLVRFNSNNWHINPRKIGIMGFSAGGHLASTLGTHFDYGKAQSSDPVEKLSCRPDFMVLIYPVITFLDSIAHLGSKANLLGLNPSKDLVENFSNELQVKADTPPTFLVHADNDSVVFVENTLRMYAALRKKHISAELHILSEGGHGFGLATGFLHLHEWTNNLRLWLATLNAN